MLKKIYTPIIIIFLFVNCSFSQIAVGEWREHLPYNHTNFCIDTDSKIFCSSDVGLFSYDKNTHAVERHSKVNGMSDIGVSFLAYEDETKTTLIAYSNANIDLIKDNTIYNIPDISRESNLGDKTIYHVQFINRMAYLSCGFGIVVVDIEKREVKDTYLIGSLGSKIKISETAFDGSFLYAATSEGVYRADINGGILADYNNWSRIENIPSFNSGYSGVCFFQDKIYLTRNDVDSVYSYDGFNYSDLELSSIEDILHVIPQKEKLIVIGKKHVYVYGDSLNIERIIYSYGYGSMLPNYAALTDNDVLYIADENNGLVRSKNDWIAEQGIFPDGPNTKNVVDLDISNSTLWVATGGKNGHWGNLWYLGEVNFYSDGQWFTVDESSDGKMDGSYDILGVDIDPTNSNHVAFSSWGGGVVEYLNDEVIERYDEYNSTLQSAIPDKPYCRVHSSAFDLNGNLWVANSGVTNPVSVMKKNGTWTNGSKWMSFSFQNIIDDEYFGDMIITQYNHKWILMPRGSGIFVFDDNGTIDNVSDDRYKRIDIIDNDGKVVNDVYSISEDQDGSIWIGTNKGVLVYYNPTYVFENGTLTAQRILLNVDGTGQYLLGTETVTDIAIDGGNRKWFATEGAGVFLMSEDGTELIESFNVDNSPLFSNNISSIAIDDQSGEVYFGTSNGIVSYRGTSTEGSNSSQNAYVFPNPVRPEYSGVITIKGLVANSDIRITDIAGNIVYHTISEGGQAIWDGLNFSGNKVQTGVYLVFSTNSDGTETNVGKILFIN